MPLVTNLPTSASDARLQNWQHTIELADGLVTKGKQDLRGVVDLYGLPESLEGKTALDVGTGEGFWAFEMERRGAEKVVAIDAGRWDEFDWLPRIRESRIGEMQRSSKYHFDIAHAMRESRVEHRVCNVYELSPEAMETWTFDVVFCGNLLVHLQNPLKALGNICSVTREMAIVGIPLEQRIESEYPDEPWLRLGHRDFESELGQDRVYWRFSTRALEEMMRYCGFAASESTEPFDLPGTPFQAASVIGHRVAPD